MRIGELLLFAPGIPFDEVDFSGERLPDQVETRLRGFYLDPAKTCAEGGHGFATGILLLSCIDALARMVTLSAGGRGRFEKFARDQLTSFASGDRAHRLYEAFRNGLVHEGRIKSGAQFSFDFENTVEEFPEAFVINPSRLGQEVESALQEYIEQLRSNEHLRHSLAKFLSKDHEKDRRS